MPVDGKNAARLEAGQGHLVPYRPHVLLQVGWVWSLCIRWRESQVDIKIKGKTMITEPL